MTDTSDNLIDVLVDNAKAGDRTAFGKLVALLMNRTVALTYRMTGDMDAAKDLAQDTFVSAWQNLSGFKGASKFESWIYRIASNKALNYLKRESRISRTDAVLSLNSRIARQRASIDMAPRATFAFVAGDVKMRSVSLYGTMRDSCSFPASTRESTMAARRPLNVLHIKKRSSAR